MSGAGVVLAAVHTAVALNDLGIFTAKVTSMFHRAYSSAAGAIRVNSVELA